MSTSKAPQIYSIGDKHKLKPYEFSAGDELSDLIRDPRGVVWMWEPPRPTASYVMGIDVSYGIPNWSRTSRSRDDYKTDNGVISIVRCGESGLPDHQVAEYAAPVDPEILADIANALGRVYAGKDHDDNDGQCRCIIEAFPGPGFMTQQRMLSVHGYTNHYRWTTFGDIVPSQTPHLGWRSGRESVPILWMRGTRHIQLNKIRLNSPALIEEMSNAEMDVDRARGRAIYGAHDDRVTAILLAIWFANQWSLEVETERTEVRTSDQDDSSGNWQASAITAEDMYDAWSERFDSFLGD